MRAGERRSDVESELASDDPMDLDDMVFSDEEESREVTVTTAERRDPVATSTGEEQEAARCAEVPTMRKRAASADAVGGRAAKRTRSPRPRWCLRSRHRPWRTRLSKPGGPRSGLVLV